MGQNIDLKAKFNEYFNELEGFSLRSERFYEEFESGIMRGGRILEWLEAAYMRGAQDMAQDTLDTLGDYAAAVAGIEEPRRFRFTPSECYDGVHQELMVYYTKVLDNKGVE